MRSRGLPKVSVLSSKAFRAPTAQSKGTGQGSEKAFILTSRLLRSELRSRSCLVGAGLGREEVWVLRCSLRRSSRR